MSEKNYRKISAELKPFLTPFLVVIGSVFLASCGGGTNTEQAAQSEVPDMRAQAVTGGTVPGTWTGRVPTRYLKPIESKVNIKSLKYGLVHPSRITVYLKDGATRSQLEALCKLKGWQIVSWIPDLNTFSVDINNESSPENLDSAIAQLESSAFIDGVAPVGIIGTQQTPTDPVISRGQYDQTWNLDSIRLSQAWAIIDSGSTRKSPVKIGILDQGFRLDHEDQAIDAVVYGRGINPTEDHGMHVANIIGAKTNSFGSKGIAYDRGAFSIVAADLPSFAAEEVEEGMRNILSAGATVINGSFGVNDNKCKWNTLINLFDPTGCLTLEQNKNAVLSTALSLRNIRRLIERFEASNPGKSVLIVQAAGNLGHLSFPDSNRKHFAGANGYFASAVSGEILTDPDLRDFYRKRVLVVGAYAKRTGQHPRVAFYSNLPSIDEYADYPYIVAPGGTFEPSSPTVSDPADPQVYSALNSSPTAYGVMSGTSMAAPHVTGVVALIRSLLPNEEPRTIKRIILETSNNSLRQAFLGNEGAGDGYRYLNAEAAVKEAIRRQAEANCGDISKPTTIPLALTAVKAGVPYTYTVTTTSPPKGGKRFASYLWRSSEGFNNAAFVTPDIQITLNTPTTPPAVATITVTPSLDDGTICTGATKTLQVTVLPAGGSVKSFSDTFSSTAIDSTKWTNNGYTDFGGNPPVGIATVDASGIAQFPAWAALNTKGKVTFQGTKIVVEARMGGTESRFILADGPNPSQSLIMLSNTPYCNWGMNIQARGPYKPSGPNGGCSADIPVPYVGNFSSQMREYRLTIDGTTLIAEAGPTLADIRETITMTLGTSIAGRSFFLTIGTGAQAYSPGSVDWVRVGVDQPTGVSSVSVDHLATPASYDNVDQAGVTYGQTFKAIASTVNGLKVYVGDPSRPNNTSVNSLVGPVDLVLYQVGLGGTLTLVATKAHGSAASSLSGLITLHFDAPVTVTPGIQYFLGLRAVDAFGLGLRSLTSSTYADGSEAWIPSGSSTLTLHSTGRDLSFAVLSSTQ